MIPSASPATHPLAAWAVGPTRMKLYFSQYGSQTRTMSSASRPPPRSAGCSQTISPWATFGSYVSGMNTQNLRFDPPAPSIFCRPVLGFSFSSFFSSFFGSSFLASPFLASPFLGSGALPAGFGATRAFSADDFSGSWSGMSSVDWPRTTSTLSVLPPLRWTSRVSDAPDRNACMRAMNWSRPLNARGPRRLDARRERALGQLRGRAGLPRADLHDPVARLQPGPLGRRLRVDEPDLDPRLRVVAHQKHAQEAGVPGRQGGGQRDVLELLHLVPALDLEGDLLALVLGPQRVQELGLVEDRLAVRLDHVVARLQADRVGRRVAGRPCRSCTPC